VLLAAGERAYHLYANDQAAQHFGAALALMREGRRTELLPSVLERLGEAWERVGETAAAIAVWSEARTLHERASSASSIARLHRRLALAEWDRGHFDVAQAHLEAGLQALAGSEPSAELADLLHVRVILLVRRGDFHGVSAAAQELATLAEQLGSRRVLAEAYLAQMRSFLMSLDVVAAREAAWHALHEAEGAGEPLLIQRAHDMLCLTAFASGEHTTARHHATLSLALARQLGAPTLEPGPRYRLISLDLLAGKWDEAVRESAEVVAHLGAWFAPAAERAADHLVARGQRVLDLGAGAAPWSLALAARNPDIRVTAVDVPAVLAVTRQVVATSGYAARFDYLSGDLFAVDLGRSAYDLAIAGNLCHLFDEATNRRLLGRLFATLRPGGTLAILDALPNERLDGPRPVVLYALGLLLRTSRGQVYPFSTYVGWLREVGYEAVERTDLSEALPISLLTARRPAAE
jgi:SAM-dependent methyltransferase